MISKLFILKITEFNATECSNFFFGQQHKKKFAENIIHTEYCPKMQLPPGYVFAPLLKSTEQIIFFLP